MNDETKTETETNMTVDEAIQLASGFQCATLSFAICNGAVSPSDITINTTREVTMHDAVQLALSLELTDVALLPGMRGIKGAMRGLRVFIYNFITPEIRNGTLVTENGNGRHGLASKYHARHLLESRKQRGDFKDGATAQSD